MSRQALDWTVVQLRGRDKMVAQARERHAAIRLPQSQKLCARWHNGDSGLP